MHIWVKLLESKDIYLSGTQVKSEAKRLILALFKFALGFDLVGKGRGRYKLGLCSRN